MDRSLLEDPAAVAAMAAGNPAGLESVYRRYADRLYAYARSIVGDDDTAADVVQETFLVAQERVRQLRDPGRLGSWLYTIARNEALGKLRARKRTVMLAGSHEPVLDTDPGRALHAEQVRELVHAASAGMNDGDKEVFELTVRHGLSAAEVARVLDISDKHAHARISRVRSQFEGALGALVLARDGRGRCEQLDAIVQGWDGRLTALLRKRIERHARDCDICTQRRRERMNPAGLLASYAALPFLAVAADLWPRLQLVSFPSGPGAGSAGSGGSGPGGSGSGGSGSGGGTASAAPPTLPMPVSPVAPVHGSPAAPVHGSPVAPVYSQPPKAPRKGSTVGLVAGAVAAVLLIMLGVSAVRLMTLGTGTAPDALSSPATVDPASPPPPSATGDPTTSPSVEVTTPPPTTTQPPPPPPPPFSVTANGAFVCPGGPPPNELEVTATGTVPLDTAQVFYREPPTMTLKSLPMSVSSLTAELTFATWSTFAPEVAWWVVANATDGRTFTTPEVTAIYSPC